MINYLILVTGRVQGVGFRYMTWRLADELGLVGQVENLADGRVKITVPGPAKTVKHFLKEVAAGPSPAAVVTKVQVKEQALEKRDSFVIAN